MSTSNDDHGLNTMGKMGTALDNIKDEDLSEVLEIEDDSHTTFHLVAPSQLLTRHERSNSLGRDEEIVEYVIDDDGAVEEEIVEEVEEIIEEDDDDGDDDTEVEYYDDSDNDVEEVELDDDYEEIELPDGSSIPASPSTQKRYSSNRPSPASALDAHLEETPEEGEEPGDEEEEDDDVSRGDVIEAIQYIMNQEQVVKYGLLSQKQADELIELPLPELKEIMNHFELCDNNGAPIRWDIVLTIINPDYGPQEEDEISSDEEDDDDVVADLPPPMHRQHSDDGDSAGGDNQASYSSIRSDQGAGLHGSMASVGSGYTLEVTNDDCDSSVTSTDASYVLEVVEEEELISPKTPKSNLDPRIRAMYTKSMVELERRPSIDE